MKNNGQQLDLSIDEYQKNSNFLKSNPEMGLEGIDQERYYYFLNNIVNSIKEQGYLIYNQDELKKQIFVELDKVLFGREDNTFHTKPNLTAPAYATVSDLQRESEVRNQADTRITNSLSVFLGQYNADAANNINKFNLKQDKTDNNLATNDKTVVGAINELKASGSDLSNYYDKPETDTLLDAKQASLVDGNYTNVNNNKIDVTDDTLGTQINTVQTGYGLLTTAQTIVQAINEIKGGGIDPSIYQLKTDDTLTTTDKTVVGAINEVKGVNDTQTTNITNLGASKQDILANGNYTTVSGNQINVTDDTLGTQINTVQNNYGLDTSAQTIKEAIGELLSDINTVNLSVSKKQNIIDNTLNTTSKTVPGAINEVLSTVSGKQNILANGNYTTVSGNQVNVTDDTLGTQINTVQNNYALATNAQTIKEAVGEIVSVNNAQTTIINQNTTDIQSLQTSKQATLDNGNYTEVDGNKVSVLDSNLGTQINTVQNNYGLDTSAQTIKEAIGELVGNLATTTTQVFSNTTNIDLKQNINEATLNTTSKTVPGSINEVLSKVNTLTTTIAGKQNNLANGNYTTVSGNKVNVTSDSIGTQVNTVQNNYTLATTAQTIKGAVEELLSDINTVNLSVASKQNTLANGNYTTVTGNQVNVNDVSLGTQVNTVQSNYSLATTAQTIKGAINEIVGVNNTQNTNINQNASNVTALNTSKQNTLVNGSYTTISGNQVNVADSSLGTQVNTVQNTYGLVTSAQTIKGAIAELSGVNTAQNTNIANNTAGLATINGCVSVSTAPSNNKKLVANNTALADITNPQDYVTKAYTDSILTNWKSVGTLLSNGTAISCSLISDRKYRILYNLEPTDGAKDRTKMNYIYKDFYYYGPSTLKKTDLPNSDSNLSNNNNIVDGYFVVAGDYLYGSSYGAARLILAQQTRIVICTIQSSSSGLATLGNLIALLEEVK